MTSGALGVFGGTFNPVHNGHLRSALEIREALGLEQVLLVPAAQPPLRELPDCDAEFRADLVELAVQGEPGLACDRRELSRQGPSYTYDTLAELRAEVGPGRSLCLVVGTDTLERFEQWHRWEELLSLAHLVIVARPGWNFPDNGRVADWLRRHHTEALSDLHTRACGGVHRQCLRQLPISATEIREIIAAGRSPRFLLPERVLERIEASGVYRPSHAQEQHGTG